MRIGITDKDSLLNYIELKHGLDQELFNGYQYYERYSQLKGDPYFPENSFYEGSVYLGGTEYAGLNLKYDCYAQQLVLEYTDLKERYNQLIIDPVHIDSFRLGSYRFQKMSLSDQGLLFYQVLNAGPVTCFVHWKKEIASVSYDFQYAHEFAETSMECYTGYNGQILPVYNKKTFVSIFPDPLKSAIRKYFRQQHFSFREPAPGSIQNLLDYTAGQLKTNTGL